MEWRGGGARAGSSKQGLQNSRATTASESSERQTVRACLALLNGVQVFTEYVVFLKTACHSKTSVLILKWRKWSDYLWS